jgi:hypothetical protein
VDAIAVVAVLAYFGFAAYNGQAGPAASATWKYGVQGAGFLAGSAVIWGLWQVKSWREPVAIFTAIVVLAFLLNSYSNIGKELSQVMGVLPGLKGSFNWNANAAPAGNVSTQITSVTPGPSTSVGGTVLGGAGMPDQITYMSGLPSSDQGLLAWAGSQFNGGFMPSGLPNWQTLNDLNNQASGDVAGGAAGL